MVAAVATGVAAGPRRAAEPRQIPARGSVEAGGVVYSFDALTGVESLFDAATDRDVLAERRAELPRFRERLAKSLGVRSLDEMVEAHRAAAEELRRLGYL